MTDQIKFGTDGWRGIIADDFTYANVRRVAQGTAEYMKSRSADPLAVVGYDCRFASEDFARMVAEIFATNGVRTLIFDRPSPTQVASWTVIDRKATGAAIRQLNITKTTNSLESSIHTCVTDAPSTLRIPISFVRCCAT